jgi:hypothetical protein
MAVAKRRRIDYRPARIEQAADERTRLRGGDEALFVFDVDVRPKHPEGGQNCLGSRSGGGLRFLRAMGRD